MKKKKPEKRPIKDRMTAARRTGAILALVSTSTIEQAAKMAKVGRSTMFRWMNDPAFMDELTAARKTAFTGGLNALKSAIEKAVGVLVALLESRSEATRRASAVAVIELGLRVHEGEELEVRLRRLEEIALGEPGGMGGRLSIAALRQSMTDCQESKGDITDAKEGA